MSIPRLAEPGFRLADALLQNSFLSSQGGVRQPAHRQLP
jgi:hypothetical protein